MSLMHLLEIQAILWRGRHCNLVGYTDLIRNAR